MKYIAIVLFFLVNTYAAASDVFYGINDASTQVGQRFYCGLLACGIVKTQLGITEVTLGANAVVLTTSTTADISSAQLTTRRDRNLRYPATATGAAPYQRGC